MPAPARRLRVALCLGLALPLAGSTLHAQRKTFEQQMQENQQRLEGIRRERSEVEDELTRLRTQAHSLADELQKDGRSVTAEGLQPVSTAKTVRVRNGRLSTTDGPFAETKEQLGGFFLIEAADHAEALRIASKLPSARYGCIELRPVRELHT